LAMVAILPASADKPVCSENVVKVDFTYSNCRPDMPDHLEETIVLTMFFNRYGGDRRGFDHEKGTATLIYNSHTLTIHLSTTSTWDWIYWYDAIITVRGAEWKGTLPGYGAGIGTVGKQEIQDACHDEDSEWVCEDTLLHLSGMNYYDQEAICDYLLNGK
jgi:hypothetical protein